MIMPGDPLSRPLIEIVRELRDRRTSARELVEAAIARHESVGERLHAYSFWAPEQARAVADAADAAIAVGVSVGPLQGLRVTIGRWSAGGVVPLFFTLDTPGLLARSVCDLAYGFAALDPAGMDPLALIAQAGTRDLAGIRIGVGDPFLWHDCDPGIAETV